jgi:ATP phosphoribosyltransferase
LGLVGRNVLAERSAGENELREVMALGFGRCRLSLAAPERFAYLSPASLNGLRIATTYPELLGRFLAKEGVDAEIVEMRGAVEVAPRLKLADLICDLVSTGATQRSIWWCTWPERLTAGGLKNSKTIVNSSDYLSAIVRQCGTFGLNRGPDTAI